MLAHEHAGRARVIQMDVAEQQVAEVRQLQTALCESGFQRLDGRGRPAVEERRPVVGVEHVAGNGALDALVQEVDRLGRRHPWIL